MLQDETLTEIERGKYEEPEGEFLEFIRSNPNSISVLTRIESDKVQSDLPDPAEYNVADLEQLVKNKDLSDDERADLIATEKNGDNRVTAIKAIEEA